MTLVESLPIGVDTAQWTVWGTVARIVLTRPDQVAAARALVQAELDAVDAACSRFRDDSELARMGHDSPVRVSFLLTELVGTALDVARRTDGDVDPTVGSLLRRLGYDRDFAAIPLGSAHAYTATPAPGWRTVGLDGDRLEVPAGVELDLGATAKAWAADRCAAVVAAELDTGVMVGLGGDIATAGAAPAGGWPILVRDRPGEPECTIAIPAGAALATSSTISRAWARGARHHIVDPATGMPAERVWRTVSVAARTCVEANMFSTAAVVRGSRALGWLRGHGVAARLVDAAGRVVTVGGWPC
jgi:thiamine biosynthesis lipoprotein